MSDWKPLQRATHSRIPKKIIQELIDKDPKVRDLVEKSVIWVNDKYQVAVRVLGPDPAGGEFIHLSIKRHDKEPCKDWRDFQRIKNQLCGEEAEGLELYPAESRIVDTANQYHLWVFTKHKLEIGFPEGMKADSKRAEDFGAKQRDGDTTI